MMRSILAGFTLGLFIVPASHAAFVSYDNETDFLAAIGGLTIQTLDFEGFTSPATVASGAVIEDVTITYSIPGFSVIVDDDFATTSGQNYLGTDGDGAFFGGDSFTLDYGSPISAFGLYIISADLILDNDITLMTSTGGVANLVANIDQSLSDGDAYFIGMVTDDPLEAFSSVTLTSFSAGFAFNVDDISAAAIPIPSAFILFASSLLPLLVMRR